MSQAYLGTRPQTNAGTLANGARIRGRALTQTWLWATTHEPQGTCSRSVPRCRMSPMIWMLIVWGVLTAVLIVLLIYRSTLTMQEDDQLFLGDSESHMEQEQIQLMHKVNKINPLVRWLGAASGLLILVIAGLAIYQGLNQVQ